MNIEQLQVGDIYKNYKTLCTALGQPIKEGKSRQLQVKDWDRYFTYKKSGHSFIIDSILETPIEKVDLRKEGNNRVRYIDKIETLILDLLAQEENDGEVFLSRDKLLKRLSMINENYAFGKYKPFKLSALTDVTVKEIRDFYEVSDSMLRRNLSTAIDNLENQSLLDCNKIKTVCIANTKFDENINFEVKSTKRTKKDNYGDEEIELGIDSPVQNLIHRKAEVEEIQAIIGAQRDVLLKLKCKDISEVFKKNKADEFYKDVNRILFEDMNILFYYDSYQIISNKDRIITELESEERVAIMKELNEEIVEKLNANTEDRHIHATAKFEATKKGKYEMRMAESYVDNVSKLTDLLIGKEAAIIRYK